MMRGTDLIAKARLYGALLKDVHTLAGPHRPVFYTALIFAFVLSLADGIFMILAVDFVMVALGSQSEFSGPLKSLTAIIGLDGAGAVELVGAFALLLAGLLRATISGIANTFNIIAATRTVNHARRQILESVLGASFSYLDQLKSGYVREVLSTSVGALIRIVQNLMQFLASALTVLLLTVVLFNLSWTKTVIVLAAALALAPLKLLSVRYVHRFAKASALGRLNLMERINETLLGIRQIKLQNRQDQFLTLVDRESRVAELAEQRAKLLASWESPATQIVVLVLVALLALAARNRVAVADLVAYLLVLYRTLTPAIQASQLFTGLVKKLPEVRYAIAFYRLRPDEQEPSEDRVQKRPMGNSLALSGVSFSYDGIHPVLRGISFTARRGQFVAVVGPSGSGKSTLLHLMLRMYDPVSGSIGIDEHQLRDLSPRQVRDVIGLVSQDVHLFNLPICDIIRGTRTDLTDAEIVEIARTADAHGFISELPDGYRTVVGERGVRLSGGQRQRLFIAQVLARKTPILLLDEATSALDSVSEAKIFEDLKRIQRDRMLIVITHRVELVRHADCVIVLDQGQVAEMGSWDQLVERQGLFWTLLRQRDRAEDSADSSGHDASLASDVVMTR